MKADLDIFREKTYDIVKSIPQGFVLTYGMIAWLAEKPRHARIVGRFMSQAPNDIPAHRVVNHQGQIAESWPNQRKLLEAEGVQFKENGCVNLKKHIWQSIC